MMNLTLAASLLLACPPNANLDFDGDSRLVTKLGAIRDAGGVEPLRSILRVRQGCTDGASRLMVTGYLGNEILLAHPADLLAAMAREKTPAELAARFARAEPDAYFAVECRDDPCRKGRRAAFARKDEALAGVKPTEATRPLWRAMRDALAGEMK